ncbi:Pyruvate dehydrogenase phosphatase regulatory subunit, mitochondrial [Frankliniella fusca]|uniref:Pyruvate dehydrogenase phosphatase regulatory subunit, mitochondrial n=1 Tax=Frankliniella fusca TaxID=407009 RepID=A0AAE1LPD9_9NEOP|nr:Pyruvate dehydrogenase phosphatase regulatory subunit, mitochondrial [Frankliniella fusca]
MLKLVLLLAVLAAASAQLITPYLSTGAYINPLYRNGLYAGYNLPYAYNYNYGYGLGLGYDQTEQFTLEIKHRLDHSDNLTNSLIAPRPDDHSHTNENKLFARFS